MNFVPQHDQMDCGPACISMITSFYGKEYPIDYLRSASFITREGVSLLGISEAAENIGFKTFSAKLPITHLLKQKDILPCVLHWNQNHFVVLKKITRGTLTKKYWFHIADPAHGMIKIKENVFRKSWLSGRDSGIALFLEPTTDFFKKELPEKKKISFKYLFPYLKNYKKQFFYMFALLFIGSCLTLVFPFLTQALIDKGVDNKDMNLIILILLAQLGVFLGTITIEIFRNWLMLRVGTYLSIEIISNFLKKMLKLPIRFFDTKTIGDFNQRIQDNARIEEFLTSQSISTFFSIITFSVFFAVLWYYDFKILFIYFLLTIVSISWSFYWLRRRKILDYYQFQRRSENQEAIYEMLNGVTEMKLNQFEAFKIKKWEVLQRKLFTINIKILKLDQLQLSGFSFLNQLKNILVTFFAARYVVKDEMTLGMLLSISYIIGQMNSPIDQLVNFFRSLQDAKLSLERLNEVENQQEDEHVGQKVLIPQENYQLNGFERGIRLQGVDFQYGGSKSPFVLKNIDLLIPEGKVTAIVGASGSGKTTLMKLLLGFFYPQKGAIFYNNDNIVQLSPQSIRRNSGVVLQNGYVFSETIERNIATGDDEINEEKLDKAVRVANIKDFIDSLPLRYQTKIGPAGLGLSGGQKQRILIARAIYKNPTYFFLDEATSALDAENENIIHCNLQSFFKNRTVLIIAHRLSTVKNADRIAVLKKGEIIEYGSHDELSKIKGEYFKLVRNQLELGT